MKIGIQPSVKATVKNTLSATLKNWLPLLQANIRQLEVMINEQKYDNPFIEVESGFEEKNEKIKKNIFEKSYRQHSSQEHIEKLTISSESLHDKLFAQIDKPLFPTPISQKIAHEIIFNLDEQGYFEGNNQEIADKLGVDAIQVEKIRTRFAQIEPSGIGALDYKESFKFQIEQMDLDAHIYELCMDMVEHLKDIYKFKKRPFYDEALKVIKKLKNPPAIDYFEQDIAVTPDLLISWDKDPQTGEYHISLELNGSYYPKISIGAEKFKNDSFVKQKIKEANNLINALEMRKSTLLKVGNIILERQYDFFRGGDIRPMKLKDIADELEYNQSTISRAISDKYIACDRGMIRIKDFFTTSLDSDTDVSNAAIKEFISNLIKNENKDKPLSDAKLLDMIQEKFGINIVRRTITKYRKQLNIGSSSERKRYL